MLKKILLSCFAIVGLTFFLSCNSYAVEDVSHTINSSASTQICNTNSPKCSDYNYLIITDNSSSFPYRTDGNASFSIISPSGTLSYNIALGVSPSYLLNISDGDYRSISVSGLWLSSGQSFTVTLSENNPSGGITPEGSLSITTNGTYDVTNYASAVVDIATEEIIDDPISNDFQKVFFAIVEKIIPAFGILLVVWFGIDMLSSLIFGRGR